MEEHADFEPRAVLGPSRARRSQLAILLPVVALAVAAWAGISGTRPDQSTAATPHPTAVAVASVTAEESAPVETGGPPPTRPARPARPTQVLGLDVHRLDDALSLGLDRDTVVAIAGWYSATAITDCPPVVVVRRPGALPEVHHDAERLAYCGRSGVLYASRPDGSSDGQTGIPASFVIGVATPPGLEIVGRAATEVVVVSHFVPSGDACVIRVICRRELVIDYLGWAAGA